MSSRAASEYRYEKLTWPEINEAIAQQQVCIVPCGAVEQHGEHLPLDVDLVCPGGIAQGVGAAMPDKVLVLPTIAYGYTGHVMDFPGTINTHYETFIRQVLDVTKSLAYHGFKKIILLNGHGSNMPNLDLAARRTNLETDAECLLIAWWHLLTINPDFMSTVRDSVFPGGWSHACELETSLYLYLDEDNVRKDRISDHINSHHDDGNPYIWVDLISRGPAALTSWTSTYTPSGVIGEPSQATRKKGEVVFHEAVGQLCGLVNFFRDRPKDVRQRHQATRPTMPIPWGQHDPTDGD
ncbi:Creatinine amidohydrolase [Maioricimonas rarisocia]|uniref:Creatinine amidohydrolase n=1 Tax=Maioricimonas rarisocia TaxID=2528026 RepID=A0A517ZDB8_9PLAN|nr:creatininase family protein [Maioricimonas rarisocia]QDU40461.1 Creatinine amidohydrolase [Maioricimonas rarisocia]